MSALVPAGRLDRQIIIQSPTATQDSYGEEIVTWSTFASVWAWKKDIRGRERFAAAQELAEEMTVFVIPWLDGVTVKMRVTGDGKTYRIEGLAELGRHEGLEIAAVAVLP